MKELQLINQFVDVLLYSWLTLVMLRRVICKHVTYPPLKFTKIRLLRNSIYISEVLLLILVLITVCTLSNEIVSFTSGKSLAIGRSIAWMIYHKLLTFSLLLRYKHSQPKIIINLIKDINIYIYGRNYKNNQQRSDSTGC